MFLWISPVQDPLKKVCALVWQAMHKLIKSLSYSVSQNGKWCQVFELYNFPNYYTRKFKEDKNHRGLLIDNCFHVSIVKIGALDKVIIGPLDYSILVDNCSFTTCTNAQQRFSFLSSIDRYDGWWQLQNCSLWSISE